MYFKSVFCKTFKNNLIDFFQNDLDDPDRGMLFVCSATHKTKSMYFFLVQTEQVLGTYSEFDFRFTFTYDESIFY